MNEILIGILQSIHNFCLCYLKKFQKISLTILLEIFILTHSTNEFIRSYDRCGSTISHLAHQVKGDRLDEGEETIGQGIRKDNSIGNTPTILRRVSICTIINNGSVRIRT